MKLFLCVYLTSEDRFINTFNPKKWYAGAEDFCYN